MNLALADVFEDASTVGEEALMDLEELGHDSWMEFVRHI